MARGIPLDSDRATFEAFEERVEASALVEHLASYDEPDQELDACAWCDVLGHDCPICAGCEQ